jgi:hypothetical protein
VRRPRRLTAASLLILVSFFAGGAIPGTLARLTDADSVTGNTFTTAATFGSPPTISDLTVALDSGTTTAGYLRRGSSYRVYATVSGSPTSVTADVSSVSTGTTALTLTAGSYTFGAVSYTHRSAVVTTNAALASASYSFSVTASNARGATTSTGTATVSTRYVFRATTASTGTNCLAAQKVRDMELGFVPSGPEETHTRSSTGTATFCSDTFTAGSTIPAGTTRVDAYIANSAGSSCALTATLYRNGTTSLGTGTLTVPGNSGKALRTWSFSTTAATFAAGDRVDLHLSWQGVRACDSTNVYWNGAATPSSVTLP